MSPRASCRTGRARVARLAVVAAACLVLLAGCKTDVGVDVALHADGSGAVTVSVVLDAQAAAKVGDLSKVLAVDDLRKAGWSVAGPGPAHRVLGPFVKDGRLPSSRAQVPATSVAVVVSRPFDNVDQANAIVAGISGPEGPLRGVRFGRSSSFASTTLTARGHVDLSAGLDTFGDAALTKALGGTSLTELVTKANGGTKPPNDSLAVALAVQPHGFSFVGEKGDVGSFPYSQATATLGAGGRSPAIDVHGSQRHTMALLLAGLAILAALGALVVTVRPLLPGREPPPPSYRKRQHHSATDSWDYVAGRGGSERLDPKAAKQAHRGRSGRHRRPRGGGMPAWKLDEITVHPDEQVVARPVDPNAEPGDVPDAT